MSDLHARERQDHEWGRPVADLIEDDEVVGMAYEDEGELLVEFYPDAEGEPRLYVVADLQRVLDTVSAMLGAEAETPGRARNPRPTRRPPSTRSTSSPPSSTGGLYRRGPEDEGFYPIDAAVGIINRCGDLGLAVVALEGFTLHSGAEDKVGRLLPPTWARPTRASPGAPSWPAATCRP